MGREEGKGKTSDGDRRDWRGGYMRIFYVSFFCFYNTGIEILNILCIRASLYIYIILCIYIYIYTYSLNVWYEYDTFTYIDYTKINFECISWYRNHQKSLVPMDPLWVFSRVFLGLPFHSQRVDRVTPDWCTHHHSSENRWGNQRLLVDPTTCHESSAVVLGVEIYTGEKRQMQGAGCLCVTSFRLGRPRWA